MHPNMDDITESDSDIFGTVLADINHIDRLSDDEIEDYSMGACLLLLNHYRCTRTNLSSQVISYRPCGRSGPFGPLTLHRPVPAHPRMSWSSPRLHVPSPANSRFRENRHRISVPLISPDSLQH